MPRIFGGKEARQAFKKGKPDLAADNTVCYLQILGLGTDCDDAIPSVLLFFDRQRYLFNVGEGFQRFCVEHKVKMNRVSSCLLTRLTGDASGGIPGMCLTMAEAGVQGPSRKPQLDIIGPTGLNALANRTRSFISSSAVGINALEFGSGILPMPVVPLPAAWSRPTPPPWANHFKQLQNLGDSSDISQSPLQASNSLEGGGAERLPEEKRRLPDLIPEASGQRGSITDSQKSALTAESMVDAPRLQAAQSAVPGAPRLVQTSTLQHGGAEEGKLPSLQSEFVAKRPLQGAEQAMAAGSAVAEQLEGGAAEAPAAPESSGKDSNWSRGTSGQEWRGGQQGAEGQDEDMVPVLPGAGAGLVQPRPEIERLGGVLGPVVDNELLTIIPVLLLPEDPGRLEPQAQELETALPPAKKPRLNLNTAPPADDSICAERKNTDASGTQTQLSCTRRSPFSPFPQCGQSPFTPPEKSAGACYVCELSRVPGRFLPDKAIELGVPRGEMFATLKSWKPVTLEDGRVIEPHLVNEPFHLGPIAVIVDCPDESYLPSLFGAAIWRERLFARSESAGAREGKQVDVVCHLAAAEIVERDDYQEWLAEFGDETRHIFVNSTATGAAPIMTSSALIQARLNCVHPQIFPVHITGATESADGPEPRDEADVRGQQGQALSHVGSQLQTGGVVGAKGAPILGGPSSVGATFTVNGKPHAVGADRRIKGTNLRVAAGGVAPVRGAAELEQHGGPSSQATVANALEAVAAGASSAAPSAAAAGGVAQTLSKGNGNAEPTKPLESKRGIVLLTSNEVEKDTVPVSEQPRGPRNRRGQKLEELGPDGDLAASSEKEAAGNPTETSSAMNIDAGQQSASVAGFAGRNAEGEDAASGATERGTYARHGTTKARVKAFKVKERHVAGQNMLKFHLRPPARRGCFDDGEVPAPIDIPAAREEVGARSDLQAAIQDSLLSGEAVDTGRGPSGLIRQLGSEKLEVVFLGTGAAIPSKYRNVTGIYLNFFARGGMMVDCGEGSYGQLKRRFGRRAEDAVKNLKCIWISHIHADHHAGITRILNLRRRLLGKDCQPLLVFGPRSLHRMLYAHSQLEPLSYHFVDCCMTVPGHPGPKKEADKAAKAFGLGALGISKLESFTVDHCANAYGLLLESKDGWKLVFSGDTRPCMNVVQAAKNALILIHEATFEDALEDEAVNKKHSMTCEAVEVGHKARAYRTILTHFSQRYPKIPVIDASFQASTCIAFDLMSVNLVDLPLLPWLVRPLAMAFRGEGRALEEEGEEAAEPGPGAAALGTAPDA